MRAIPATLTTAQKSQSHRPHPQVDIYDNSAGVVRYHWTKFYDGPEADYFHAATMPGDGSLIRLYVEDGPMQVHFKRVENPDSGSTYDSWSHWAGQAVAVALASYGANVWAFRIAPDDGHLYRSDSTDNGASWTGWLDMGDISGAEHFSIAAAGKSLTEAIVLYSDGSTVYRRRLSGGTWEAAAAWSLSLFSVSGVSVFHFGDWNVAVTGVELTTLKPAAWTCVLGDGYAAAPDSWTALLEVIAAESDAATSYKSPTVLTTGVNRLWFVEQFVHAEAYQRPNWTHMPAGKEWTDNYWREPVPFDMTGGYGVAAMVHAPGVWLTNASGVWYAASSAVSVDVTDDVHELKGKLQASKGALAVLLTNYDGRYANIGVAGDTYEALSLGAELRFNPGYHTTAGGSPEHSAGMRFYVEALEFVSTEKEPSALLIEAVDWWGLLERWKARRQFVWLEGDRNIYQLLQFVLARVGFPLVTVGTTSAALTDLKPAYTINPGESGRSAARRLLSMVEDVLYFNNDTGYLNQPQAGDGSDYTYGTDHDILEARYRTAIVEGNRAQVVGDGVFTEDFDWPSIDLIGDALAQDHDLTIDSAARGHRRGTAMLRGEERNGEAGHVVVPLNCGQQINDVVSLTDLRAPISAAKRRVGTLEYTYMPKRAIYTLRIGLEAL